MKDMTENTKEPSGAEQTFGDCAPAFVAFTDECCSARCRSARSCRPKERSLITVAALTAGGNAEQLTYHLGLARDNGATETS